VKTMTIKATAIAGLLVAATALTACATATP